MNTAIYTVGALSILLLGVCMLIFLLWITSQILGIILAKIYKQVSMIYKLHVIQYWLKRLEKEGTHCFEKQESWNYKTEKDNKFTEKDIN